MKLHRIAAVAAGAALLVPAGVFAKGKPEHAGKGGKDKSAKVDKGKGHGKSKAKMFVFKGTWNDASSTVVVTGGNGRVKKAGHVGTEVAFDFAAAKVNVADTNGDGVLSADDFVDGDALVVQAKLSPDAAAPFVARKAIDQTHPKADDSEEEDEVEAEPTPEATPEVTPEATPEA